MCITNFYCCQCHIGRGVYWSKKCSISHGLWRQVMPNGQNLVALARYSGDILASASPIYRILVAPKADVWNIGKHSRFTALNNVQPNELITASARPGNHADVSDIGGAENRRLNIGKHSRFTAQRKGQRNALVTSSRQSYPYIGYRLPKETMFLYIA